MLHFYFFIFSFHLSGPLNNDKALYMKIAVCINTLPQQCSLDLKFFIPNTNQKHDMIDHISKKYRKCCKCTLPTGMLSEWALSNNGTSYMVSSTFHMINFLLFIWSIGLLYGLLVLSTELIT